MLDKKENYKTLGILEAEKLEKVLQMKEKASQNQELQQRDKHPCSSSWKVFRTILKKKKTMSKEPRQMDKKIDDFTQRFKSEKSQTDDMCPEEKTRTYQHLRLNRGIHTKT